MHKVLISSAAVALAMAVGACAWAATSPTGSSGDNICQRKFTDVSIEAVFTPKKPFPYELKPDESTDEDDPHQVWNTLIQRSIGLPLVVHCFYDKAGTQVQDFPLTPTPSVCTRDHGTLVCHP